MFFILNYEVIPANRLENEQCQGLRNISNIINNGT